LTHVIERLQRDAADDFNPSGKVLIDSVCPVAHPLVGMGDQAAGVGELGFKFLEPPSKT